MKIALVTGAYKGLGYEWCKQLAALNYKVILSARNLEKAQAAADTLQQEGLDVYPVSLDVSSLVEIEKTAAWVEEKFGQLDVLINNAGINSGSRGRISEALKLKNLSLDHLDSAEVLNMLQVNAIAPILVTRGFKTLLSKSDVGKVIHIGSWLGSIELKKSGGNYSYAVSKSALNMMNRALAYDLKEIGIVSVVVNPGWVQTDMGGSRAKFTATESVQNLIENVLQKIQLEDSGNFLNYDGGIHPW